MIFSNWLDQRKKEKVRKSKIKTAKNILMGTAAGSLSGLLGGLIFSPKSGKETRKDISNSSKDLTNNIKEKTSELKGNIDGKVSDAKDNVTEAKIKIKQKSTELKQTIDNKVSDAKNSASDAKEKISGYLDEKKASKVIDDVEAAATDNEESAPIIGQADIVENEKKSKK